MERPSARPLSVSDDGGYYRAVPTPPRPMCSMQLGPQGMTPRSRKCRKNNNAESRWQEMYLCLIGMWTLP